MGASRIRHRSYYSSSVADFLAADALGVLGQLCQALPHDVDPKQKNAWIEQTGLLKIALKDSREGHLFLEFAIPRMGKRADAVFICRGLIIVFEFKVGTSTFDRYAIDQVMDYALDLANFHQGSHQRTIVPVLVATEATASEISFTPEIGNVNSCILTSGPALASLLEYLFKTFRDHASLDAQEWASTGYRPTPTIIEAARALYSGHNVNEIARSDADATNLTSTSEALAAVIERAKAANQKTICFVTGVPGAGKTLAGLNLACHRRAAAEDEHAVFLSGNGPLVDVLREALARDRVEQVDGTKKDAHRETRAFIQNIHHFRDQYLGNSDVPSERVVVFDEAQRAWNQPQLEKFLKERGVPDFDHSEPGLLLEAMNRVSGWCTVVCLIGGGQEINDGEAGITEWLKALKSRFPDWKIHSSAFVARYDSISGSLLDELQASGRLTKDNQLHLSTSIRSFRALTLSDFVDELIDGVPDQAKRCFQKISERYPLVFTRDIQVAREWLRAQARGSERIGLLASSGAVRLKPEGVHVKAKISPAEWFLNGKDDIRSSYYLEDVATQFDIQGLELDWTCVCWDADLRRVEDSWQYYKFRGNSWENVRQDVRRRYLLNTYRVLLTRARQGMVIFIPQGDERDHTRLPGHYGSLAAYLSSIGISELKPYFNIES